MRISNFVVRPHRALALLLPLALVQGCSDSPTEVPGDAPAITAISPESLTPGAQAVLEGGNFGSTPDGNTVTVWGTEVNVLEATESSLTVRLPNFLCGPEGEAPVVVTVNGTNSDPFRHPFQPTEARELAVGELLRVASPEARCLILGQRGSRADYLVGIQSTTETVSAVTGVRVRGMEGGTASAASTAASVSGRSFDRHLRQRGIVPGREDAVSAATAAGVEWLASHRRAEAELRHRERRLLAARPELAAGPGSPVTTHGSRPARVPNTVEPGDTVDLSIPDISEDDFCQEGRDIRAVVRRVGDNSIFVEDVDNPAGGFDPEDYDLLSDEFDNQIYEELESHFGPPSDLDENGRVVVVVSESVNRVSSSAVGFVVSVDFFPDQCPGGNGGEYYYARAPDPDGVVPDPDGETGNEFSVGRARQLAPLLLAHEVTHIIQFGRRLPEGRGAQAIWIMEGQATFAEEVVGHSYSGLQPRSNLGPEQLFGEYPPAEVSWYVNSIFGLVSYFGLGFDDDTPFRVDDAPHRCTWLTVEDNEPCDTQLVAYGTTWSLLRWMSDHFGDEFGGGDRELQRRIIDSSRSGFAVFEHLLGMPKEEFLAPWAATLYADDRIQGTPDALLTFPSWNLRAVEDGVIDEAHLIPAQPGFTDFETDVQVAAASSYYQVLRGVSGHPPFALAAETSDGGALPDHMQLWVVRLR